jgi:uncharacterized protein YbjT (DUF2867 family)
LQIQVTEVDSVRIIMETYSGIIIWDRESIHSFTPFGSNKLYALSGAISLPGCFNGFCYNWTIMILVTGGTGFIGQALIRQIIASGHQVRTLIRPSQDTPHLPKGVSVEVVVSSLLDEKGVRAALRDVEVVYHLVGGESKGSKANLSESDIQTTQVLTRASLDAGIERFIYLSHLGANRASAFPVLKAKGIAENIIKTSGINYTIFRSGIVFGPGDHFSEDLKTIMQAFPWFFILPDKGLSQVQPVWIDDLVTCLVWTLEEPATRNKILEVGGSENLSLHQVVEIIRKKIGSHTRFISMDSKYLRLLTVTLESMLPVFPLSTFWLDYLAESRTTSLDSMTRLFGILPARFGQKIDYLKGPTRKLTKPQRSNKRMP